MSRAIDLSPEKRFMAMFVGTKHSGKTCAECSFRDNDDQVIDVLDFDGRIRGILGAPWINRKNINYEYFPPRMDGLIEQVNKKLEVYELYAEQRQYQNLPHTLIMDSLTSETFAMLQQSVPLTHQKGGKGEKQTGKFIGTFAMPDPGDYGFEAQTTYSILSFLRSIPIQNIIVSAHIIPTYGKLDPDNPYSETVQTGEKLSIRDKIGANIGIYFDHIFKFRRDGNGQFGKEQFFVQFRGDLACTSYATLPMGEIEITGKNFYKEILLPRIKKEDTGIKEVVA